MEYQPGGNGMSLLLTESSTSYRGTLKRSGFRTLRKGSSGAGNFYRHRRNSEHGLTGVLAKQTRAYDEETRSGGLKEGLREEVQIPSIRVLARGEATQIAEDCRIGGGVFTRGDEGTNLKETLGVFGGDQMGGEGDG